METPTENVCCRVAKCVTNFEHFFNICLDHMVLSVAIHNRADIRTDPIDYSPASYRKAAYRQFILWAHGYLRRGNRRVVPSCVVLAIRRWYPSPTGLYLGFNVFLAQCSSRSIIFVRIHNISSPCHHNNTSHTINSGISYSQNDSGTSYFVDECSVERNDSSFLPLARLWKVERPELF